MNHLKKKLISTCLKKENSTNEIKTLPSTRHLAKTLGIDLSTIHGSGKEGRITPEDLKQRSFLQHEKEPFLKLEDSVEIPLIGIRHLMAKK